MSQQKDERYIWAEKVVKGIDESTVFMQLYHKSMREKEDIKDDPAYLLQLGYAIMLDKPIAVIADYRDDLPQKLQDVADVVSRFDRDDMSTIKKAAEKAMKKLDGD